MEKQTILIIDDQKEESYLLKNILEKKYNIHQAFDLKQAQDFLLLESEQIKLVIWSFSLFVELEYDKIIPNPLYEKVKQNELTILAVIPEKDQKGEETSLKIGAVDTLTKDLYPPVVLKRVENAILSGEQKRKIEHDLLTGLYNKEAFYKKVKELLLLYPKKEFTILCIDIERFKVVNDLFGAKEGDKLLVYVGKFLKKEEKRVHGKAGHLLADVFALCIPRTLDYKEQFESMIVNYLKEYPLTMEIIPALGFYPIEDRELPVSRMCDRAILALNSIKGNYMKHSAVYSNRLRNSLIAEQEILNDMEHALENKEFQIYLQPKCEMQTGKIIGSEALVRWLHPKKGIIGPNVFIPIFEKNGFISKLDAFVWEEACILLKSWIDEGKTPIPISVNVSRINLYNLELYDVLTHLVETYKIDPKLLELEITESSYTNNLKELLSVIDRLRAYGFIILMDDFGSGYSSLNMLKDINVDILKIDMKFLKDNETSNQRGGNILESVVRMANWLDLPVIAEGVETKEQVDFLLGIGCCHAQGYYYYKPMPIEQFQQLMIEEDTITYEKQEMERGNLIHFEELIQSDFLTNTLLNNVIGGMVMYEIYHNNVEILRVNDRYYQIMKCTRESLNKNGKHILEWVPQEDHPIFYEAARQAEENPSKGSEFQLRRKRIHGDIIWVHLHLFFLAENGGRKIFYASLVDITEIKKKEEKLRLSEMYCRTAVKQSNLMMWQYDFASKSILLSKEWGSSQDQIIENVPDVFLETREVHPDSQKDYLALYERMQNQETNVCCEALILTDKTQNRYQWRRICYTVIQRNDKTPIQAVGTMEEIYEKNLFQEKSSPTISHKEITPSDNLATFCIHLSNLTLLYYQGSELEAWKKEEKHISIEAIKNVLLMRFVEKESKEKFLQMIDTNHLNQLIKRKITHIQEDFLYQTNDTVKIWISLSIELQKKEDLDEWYAVCDIRDIHRRKCKELQLADQASRDYLTGLFNRCTVEAYIEEYLASHTFGENPQIALFMLDIDNFKYINDHYGHGGGDSILQKIASILKEVFEENAAIGRLGGDEFLVFVKEAKDQQMICYLAQQVCDRLNEIYLEEDPGKKITASIGIVFVTEEDHDFESLYHKADLALYQAKNNGKNVYAIYDKDAKKEAPLQISIDTSILDELDGLICIVSQKTYQIVYCNEAMRRFLDKKKPYDTNKKCFEIFRNFNSPCTGCREETPIDGHFHKSKLTDIFCETGFQFKEKIFRWDNEVFRLLYAKK